MRGSSVPPLYLGLSEATNSFGRQRVRAAPGDTCVPTMPTPQGFHNSVFGRTDQGLQAEKIAVFVFSQRAADSNAIADVVLNNQSTSALAVRFPGGTSSEGFCPSPLRPPSWRCGFSSQSEGSLRSEPRSVERFPPSTSRSFGLDRLRRKRLAFA